MSSWLSTLRQRMMRLIRGVYVWDLTFSTVLIVGFAAGSLVILVIELLRLPATAWLVLAAPLALVIFCVCMALFPRRQANSNPSPRRDSRFRGNDVI